MVKSGISTIEDLSCATDVETGNSTAKNDPEKNSSNSNLAGEAEVGGHSSSPSADAVPDVAIVLVHKTSNWA